jgi:hypothetical protein
VKITKGQLIAVNDLPEKAGISATTVKRMLQGGYVESIKIGRTRFVYYREFLRGAWKYESSKERPGRKYANANWTD